MKFMKLKADEIQQMLTAIILEPLTSNLLLTNIKISVY